MKTKKKRQSSGTGLPVRNDILHALLNSEYKHLSPKLEHVHLKRGEIIYQADQGARREGITEAAGKLQAAELISYRRARIQILDEAGLKKKSCECYRFIRQQFDGLLKEVPGFMSGKHRISDDRRQ
jgi:hypothetical protein